MRAFLLLLLLIYIVTNTFQYRFFKTASNISVFILRRYDRKLRDKLSPAGIKVIRWANHILELILAVWILIEFGWGWAVTFIMYVFILTPIVNIFTPFPSIEYCHQTIKKDIKKRISLAAALNDIKTLGELTKLYSKVEEAQHTHNLSLKNTWM